MRDVMVSKLMNEVMAFRAGNTGLLEALMLTCGQRPEAEARVRQVLTDAGMLTDKGPQWDVLEARKAKPWTWEDAVLMLVADPAERDRLLAMSDTPAEQWLQQAAETLVAVAAARGVVLTIEQRPLKPLAMRNYETVVTVRSR